MFVIEVVAYDCKRNVEKTLWFRGDTILEAELRRDHYFVKHQHSTPVKELYFSR